MHRSFERQEQEPFPAERGREGAHDFASGRVGAKYVAWSSIRGGFVEASLLVEHLSMCRGHIMRLPNLRRRDGGAVVVYLANSQARCLVLSTPQASTEYSYSQGKKLREQNLTTLSSRVIFRTRSSRGSLQAQLNKPNNADRKEFCLVLSFLKTRTILSPAYHREHPNKPNPLPTQEAPSPSFFSRENDDEKIQAMPIPSHPIPSPSLPRKSHARYARMHA